MSQIEKERIKYPSQDSILITMAKLSDMAIAGQKKYRKLHKNEFGLPKTTDCILAGLKCTEKVHAKKETVIEINALPDISPPYTEPLIRLSILPGLHEKAHDEEITECNMRRTDILFVIAGGIGKLAVARYDFDVREHIYLDDDDDPEYEEQLEAEASRYIDFLHSTGLWQVDNQDFSRILHFISQLKARK